MLASLLLVAAACGSSSDGGVVNGSGPSGGSGADGGSAGECGAGGTMTVAVPDTSRTLDPFDGGGNTDAQGGNEMQAIYDKLVTFDVESGLFVPHMAEDLEANEDSSVWTITLREGVTFGNGDPVDAAAVKASMDRHLDPDGGSALSSAAEQIESVEVVDDLILEIALHDGWAGFPSLLAAAFGTVQNVAVIEEMGQEAFASNPAGAGAGPFELVSYRAGERIQLQAKDDYWGGEVCLDELTFTVIPEPRTAYDSLRNGEIDAMVLTRDPEMTAEAKADLDGFSFHSATQIAGDLLLINSGADGVDVPGGDVRVRQAIAAAIDPEVINQRAYAGTTAMSTGLIPEGSAVFEPTQGPVYDPDLAESLVEAVKADTGWDGSIRLDCDNSPTNTEVCIATAALLDAVGFDVKLNTQHTPTEVSTLVRVERDYELAMWGLSAYEENLWTTLKQYYSDAGNNAANFADPEMDEALDQLRGASGVDASNEALATVQKVWSEKVPGLPLATFEASLIWSDDVEGIRFNTNMVAFYDQARFVGN